MVITILLKILAVLGWILLGLLGLIIFIVLITCLVPLRYRGDFHVTDQIDELHITGKAGWLLRILSIDFGLLQKKVTAQLRIAWKKIPLTGEDDDLSKLKNEHINTETKKEPVIIKEIGNNENTQTGKAADINTDFRKSSKKQEQQVLYSEEKKKKVKTEKRKKSGQSKHERSKKNQKDNGRFTLDRIFDTINEMRLAKDEILAFFEVKSHRKLIRHLFKRLKKLGRKVLPDQLTINGELGFEDPYTSGITAAFMSVLYPRIEKIELPVINFEEKVIDLDGFLKGKLRLGSVVWFAIPLILDINLYRTIKDLKILKTKLDRSADIIKGGKAA